MMKQNYQHTRHNCNKFLLHYHCHHQTRQQEQLQHLYLINQKTSLLRWVLLLRQALLLLKHTKPTTAMLRHPKIPCHHKKKKMLITKTIPMVSSIHKHLLQHRHLYIKMVSSLILETCWRLALNKAKEMHAKKMKIKVRVCYKTTIAEWKRACY